MYSRPTVPRSIGGVLDDTLQLYKASLPSCLLPAFLASLITAVLSYFIVATMPMTPGAIPPAEIMARYRGMIGQFGIWYLIVIAASLVLYGTLIANIVAVSRGETPTFGASVALGARRAPALFVASIIFMIAITAGLILFIIPGIYVWNRFQLYMVPLVAESQGPGTSLGSSWRLVGGHWWRTTTIVFVVFVIMFVLELILGAIAGTIGVFAGGGAELASNPALMAARISMLTMLIGAIVRVFTFPLIFAAFVAVYQDLGLRKGGADLEARLGALPQS